MYKSRGLCCPCLAILNLSQVIYICYELCLKSAYYLPTYLYLNANIAMAQHHWPQGAYGPDYELDYSVEPGVPFSGSANVTTDNGWTFTGGTGPTARYPSLLTSPMPDSSSRGPEAPEVPDCNGAFGRIMFTATPVMLTVSDSHEALKYVERYMTRYFGEGHYDIKMTVRIFPFEPRTCHGDPGIASSTVRSTCLDRFISMGTISTREYSSSSRGTAA
jgi:hypothetical protein